MAVKVQFLIKTELEISKMDTSINGGLYFSVDGQNIYRGDGGSPKMYSGIIIENTRPLNPIPNKPYIIGSTNNYSLDVFINGKWEVISTNGSSENSLFNSVTGVQKDSSLIPNNSKGASYIILNASDLNGNFGVIPNLENNDIVTFNGSNFYISFNASDAVYSISTIVTLDDNNKWIYNLNNGNWERNIDDGFKPIRFWDFNSDTSSDWTNDNVDFYDNGSSYFAYETLGLNPSISRDVNFNGAVNRLIKIKYRGLVGDDSSVNCKFYFKTSSHDYSELYYKSFIMTNNDDDNVAELDMTSLTVGGSGWFNDIIGIKINIEGNFDIDWIAIGKSGWGTQYFEDDIFIGTPPSEDAGSNDLLTWNTITKKIEKTSRSLTSVLHDNTTPQLSASGIVYGHINAQDQGIYGNKGLNTSDIESWQSSFGALETYGSSLMYGKGDPSIRILSNSYYDGAWKYKHDGKATMIESVNGIISFYSAISGLEDDTLTWTNSFKVDGNTIKIPQTPATDSGSNDILTRNSSTGAIEKTSIAGINYWNKAGEVISYTSSLSSGNILAVKNSYYGNSDTSGSVSIDLGFEVQTGGRITARKITNNTCGLDFSVENGFNNPLKILSVIGSGKVGINNDTPSYSLDVNGILRTTGDAIFEDGVAIGSASLGNGLRASINSSGNVGYFQNTSVTGSGVSISAGTGSLLTLLIRDYAGAAKFGIRGDGRIYFGGLTTQHYAFPTSDGTNNQVLTTDGNGNLSFSDKTGGTGGFIQSINGDSSAAQTIAGGTGISVVNTGATHTINLTGLIVNSFNARTGAVTLTSSDVTTALGYTPYNSSNPSNYTANVGTVTSITAGDGIALSGTSTINPTLFLQSTDGLDGIRGTMYISSDYIGVNLGNTARTAAAGNHLHPGVYDNYESWKFRVNGTEKHSISSESYINFIEGDGILINSGSSGEFYFVVNWNDAQPNDIIFPFDPESLSGTYNWNIATKPNILDTTASTSNFTINISTMSDGMSGMCDFKTQSTAGTLSLTTTVSGCTAFVDSGADLNLEISTEYFLTAVRAGNKIKFNLAKYV